MATRGSRATIREVASRAGVSISSASRALNNHPDVSDELRHRVVSAARRLGYQPNLVASGLRRGLTHTVGFVVRDISNPLFADIVHGAEVRLRAAGYTMLLTNSEGDSDLDARSIDLFQQRKVDGLILSLGSETHPATLAAMRRLRTPIVLLDREVAGVKAGAVFSDHHAGMFEGVRHLLRAGHTRIALVAGPAAVRASRERLRGYTDAHAETRVAIDRDLVRLGAYTRTFGASEVADLLARKRPPTALVLGGAQLAAGAFDALAERRARVGRDIAVIACDEAPFMRYLNPPLSLISRDATEMGRMAAELLLDHLLDGGKARRVVLPTRFVDRGSSPSRR